MDIIDKAEYILRNQKSLAARSLRRSLTSYPPEKTSAFVYYFDCYIQLTSDISLIDDYKLLRTVQEHAELLSVNGEHNAAFSWGQTAYILSRRFAGCWLDFIDLAIKAQIFKTTVVENVGFSPYVGSPGHIPSHIMQFWDREAPPPQIGVLMQQWKEHHNQYAYTHLTDDAARSFILSEFGQEFLAEYNSLSHVSSKSDFARFCWTYVHGGFYIDADEKCAGNIWNLVRAESMFFLTWSPGPPPCINTWFIASKPKNPFFLHCLGLCLSHIRKSRDLGIKLNAWILTGPAVFSMVLLDTIAIDGDCDYTRNLDLMSEEEFRKICISDETLEYRSDPSANWRLEVL